MGYYGDITTGAVVDHSARRENDISAALNAFGKTGDPRLTTKGANYNRIPVCNLGSTDLIAGTPVRLTGKADDTGSIFDVERASDASKPYGILLDDLAKGGTSSALFSGSAIIEINIRNKSHGYAAPIAGVMESSDSGICRILWKSGETGKMKCVILLGSGGAGGGYSGMFKIVQTEAGDDKKKPKIKIVDGSNLAAENCGIAMINNKQFTIPAKEFSVESGGYVLLTSEYDESAKAPKTPEFKLEKTLPGHNDNTARIIIGRVGLNGNNVAIVQEQHGMAQGFIWGNCEDGK